MKGGLRVAFVRASSQSHHLLPILKHGNVRLRTALMELAWWLLVWPVRLSSPRSR